jgi:raffinose synthase
LWFLIVTHCLFPVCLCRSDKPGNHNFELLKKLVLPDGSVLRAQLPGRPTRDCLFADPARDGTR